MASISNAAANLYNYTAPVTGGNVVNDKKTSGDNRATAVAAAKLAVESTIVSIGNKNTDSALTYNASGLLSAAQTNGNQSSASTSKQAAQDAILQAQSAMSDALNSLSGDSTSSSSSDIASLLNIPGVATARQ